MNKKFNKILSVGLSVCMGAAIAGCSSGENPNSSVVPVDSTKSQLYVSNFNGGVGFEWLNKLAARFEEDFAETSFEEGKKGVQVRITNHKGIALSTIPQSKDEVYFLEEVKQIFRKLSCSISFFLCTLFKKLYCFSVKSI